MFLFTLHLHQFSTVKPQYSCRLYVYVVVCISESESESYGVCICATNIMCYEHYVHNTQSVHLYVCEIRIEIRNCNNVII